MVIELLYELSKGEAIITTGVGQHQMWAAQYYKFKYPRQLLTSAGLGAMGYGYPAALGAKVAFPNREVVDIAQLNAELKTTVAKIDQLRKEIDAIVAEIEGEELEA